MIDPVQKPRPAAAETFPEPPGLYVRADVLDEIRFNGSWKRDGLAGGLLVGRHYADPASSEPYVVVDGFVGGAHADDLQGFVRTLRSRWKESVAARATHFPEGEILGWYIAPGKDGPPDREALVLHNTFFNHPWQIGLWVPPEAAPTTARPERDTLRTGPVAVLDGASARLARPR